MKFRLLFILFVFGVVESFSQDTLNFFERSPKYNHNRFISSIALQGVGYAGSLAVLGNSWYKDYEQTSFHSFDDSQEWLQMDKAGHFAASWYMGRMGIDLMEWSGVQGKKAIWYGCAGSYLFITGVEMLDGYSKDWGFSWSDFAANTLGTGFIIGQNILKRNQSGSNFRYGLSEISIKFSFHQTDFPKYRPSLLGTSIAQDIVKDYNGQTYWMSLNLASFLNTETKFPKWLNLAFGYGGEGMISGKSGYSYMDPLGNTTEFERYRQYYVSLDIDLTKIKTRSPILKTFFEIISFVKIPTPAIGMNKHGFKFHSLYY